MRLRPARSYRANMDEGWTRWILEQYEFPYTSLSNADVRGDLSKFDVLLFADESEDTILNGHLTGTMPPDFMGGIGMEGAANIRRFVERGGGGWRGTRRWTSPSARWSGRCATP